LTAGGKGGTADGQGPEARPERTMLGRTRRIHFVGIGGIGMSGIAELLVNLGYEVSGSDAKKSDVTLRLAQLGVEVRVGHDASHVGAADVVVMSSAIALDNPEILEARRRRVPVIPRAEMLAELMRLRYGIAIAGAHGKTTTTSMVALILERAGLDPTAVIGGRLSAFGSNARLGRGDSIVVEADESDRSFLSLFPSIALVTNIDREHMETYGSWAALQDAFAEFVNKVPFYGAAVLCVDDEAVRKLMPRILRRTITYGFAESGLGLPDVAGHDMRLEAFSGRCTVSHMTPMASMAPMAQMTRMADDRRTTLGELRLPVPGRHNLLNALGAVAIALELQIPFTRIAEALAEFTGAERRFQIRGEKRGVMLVDDYGHHPTEIAAVIAAARAVNRRIVVAFQPHRYSRTRDLLPEFGRALGAADEILLTDIYSAGEAPIEGVTMEALAAAIRRSTSVPLHLVKAVTALPQRIAEIARSGDLVITFGAGSIGTIGDQILASLAGTERNEP
jgi:UDP-N-acetylmuramate--alanine ligase